MVQHRKKIPYDEHTGKPKIIPYFLKTTKNISIKPKTNFIPPKKCFTLLVTFILAYSRHGMPLGQNSVSQNCPRTWAAISKQHEVSYCTALTPQGGGYSGILFQTQKGLWTSLSLLYPSTPLGLTQ